MFVRAHVHYQYVCIVVPHERFKNVFGVSETVESVGPKPSNPPHARAGLDLHAPTPHIPTDFSKSLLLHVWREC